MDNKHPRQPVAEPIEIKEHQPGDPIPYDLLRLADPSRKFVDEYLSRSHFYKAYLNGSIIGCYVLHETNDKEVEIKNIAVIEEQQGKGIGTTLLKDAEQRSQNKGMKKITIKTGNSSIKQLNLYQKVGFSIVGMEKGYFTKNYPNPIVEDGIVCRDRITLTKSLNPVTIKTPPKC